MNGEVTPELEVAVAADHARAEFRAVVAGGRRHGIRLERIFWDALKAIAKERRVTLGGLVGTVYNDRDAASNLSSALRVEAMRSFVDQTAVLRNRSSDEAAESILLASPSPAFTLAANRRIVSFNPGFQLLVRGEFPGIADGTRQELRLSVDVPLETLISRLSETGNKPVATGFALGTADRRFRGRLNLILAPSRDDLLLAFVVGA